jgi:hypothetical protein
MFPNSRAYSSRTSCSRGLSSDAWWESCRREDCAAGFVDVDIVAFYYEENARLLGRGLHFSGSLIMSA